MISMRRKIADCTKPRRCFRKHKLPELSVFSHVFKLFFGWSVVMLFDCLSCTRLEYLWPLYLCAFELYNCMEAQGIGCCTVYIVSYVLMDTACFVLLPIEWLYLIASLYIWICYTSIAEKGCSNMTICLFLAIVSYIELSFRRVKLDQSLSYEVLLSKPLASHSTSVALSSCFNIGLKHVTRSIYPLKMRFKRWIYNLKPEKHDINDVYIATRDILDSASAQFTEMIENNGDLSMEAYRNIILSNDKNLQLLRNMIFNNEIFEVPCCPSHSLTDTHEKISVNEYIENSLAKDCNKSIKDCGVPLKSNAFKVNNNIINNNNNHNIMINNNNNNNNSSSSNNNSGHNNINNFNISPHHHHLNNQNNNIANLYNREQKNKANDDYAVEQSSLNMHKENYYKRLENHLKKVKLDLQLSQQLEEDLRSQISSLSQQSRNDTGELLKTQKNNDELQSKLHNLVMAKQADKQIMTTLRKELAEEKKQKCHLESLCASLKIELKKKPVQITPTPPVKIECGEKCKMKRQNMEFKNKCLKTELESMEKRYIANKEQLSELYQYKEKQKDMDNLVCELGVMREKVTRLETSLSSETKMKLDLFSAIGDIRRQLDIKEKIVRNQEKEIEYLKTRLSDYRFSGMNFDLKENIISSFLDPNAVAYNPEPTKSQ